MQRPLFLKDDCHYLSKGASLAPLIYSVLYLRAMKINPSISWIFETTDLNAYVKPTAQVPLATFDSVPVRRGTESSCHPQQSPLPGAVVLDWLLLKKVFISSFEALRKTSSLCQYLLTAVDVSLLRLALISHHFMTSQADHYTGFLYCCFYSLAINSTLFWFKQKRFVYVLLKSFLNLAS